MSRASYQFLGLQDLQKKLQEIAGKKAVEVSRRALQAAADVLAEEARARAPVQAIPGGGALRDSIKGVSARRKRRGGRVYIGAYVIIAEPKGLKRRGGKGKKTPDEIIERKDPRLYDHLVEFGTRPHALGKGSSINRGIIRKQTGAQHPGAKKQPFMRPAFDAGAQRAIETFARELRTLVDPGSTPPAKGGG